MSTESRLEYIYQLQQENRDLRSEQLEAKPFSTEWLRLKQEITANVTEIEAIKRLIALERVGSDALFRNETARAATRAESTTSL